MSIGIIFLIIALVFFALAALDLGLPWQKAIAIGLGALTMGILLAGVIVPWGSSLR